MAVLMASQHAARGADTRSSGPKYSHPTTRSLSLVHAMSSNFLFPPNHRGFPQSVGPLAILAYPLVPLYRLSTCRDNALVHVIRDTLVFIFIPRQVLQKNSPTTFYIPFKQGSLAAFPFYPSLAHNCFSFASRSNSAGSH